MFNTIEEALKDLKEGKLILVCDDEGRENEGDLLGLAQKVSPEMINFMITQGKGLVCCPLSLDYANRLGLNQMVEKNQDNHQTNFTISVDHYSVSTGISVKERSNTISALANPLTTKNDLKSPGHIFPLIAKDGGVLERPGHTEAAVDLAKLADMAPVGVICEVINADGTMARLPELVKMAKEFDLKLIHIQDLITYRKTHERLIKRIANAKLPTKYGNFEILGFNSIIDNEEAIALIKGDVCTTKAPLIRIHSECLTGDSFGSLRCDCGEQLASSLSIIEKEGGIIVYLRQEGRGIGLLNKIKAYALQDNGFDTVEANIKLGFADDLRDYFLASQILLELGIKEVILLSNNPRKSLGLEKYGIKVLEVQELVIAANHINQGYLNTKASKLGHLL